jgi:hypothetical protein
MPSSGNLGLSWSTSTSGTRGSKAPLRFIVAACIIGPGRIRRAERPMNAVAGDEVKFKVKAVFQNLMPRARLISVSSRQKQV